MATNQKLPMNERTLNEVLADLKLRALDDPQGRPGVKMIVTWPRQREVFRGRPAEVWAWLRGCPTCELRGYSDDDCECGGAGVRSYFQQVDSVERARRGMKTHRFPDSDVVCTIYEAGEVHDSELVILHDNTGIISRGSRDWTLDLIAENDELWPAGLEALLHGARWHDVYDTLARQRSELDRIEGELRELRGTVDQSTERGRIVAHHISAVLQDHLALSILGVGAARRVAERLATNETRNQTETA